MTDYRDEYRREWDTEMRAARKTELSPQDAWDELTDKDDRTSPEEYPDHCLITFEELQDFMSRSRCISAGNVAPSLQGPVSWRWRPRGATEWIYDPTEEWRKEHEGDIESEPLYAALSRS